jgi:hypothetical protein
MTVMKNNGEKRRKKAAKINQWRGIACARRASCISGNAARRWPRVTRTYQTPRRVA